MGRWAEDNQKGDDANPNIKIKRSGILLKQGVGVNPSIQMSKTRVFEVHTTPSLNIVKFCWSRTSVEIKCNR